MKILITILLIIALGQSVLLFYDTKEHKPEAGQIYLFHYDLEDEIAPIRVKIIAVNNGLIDYKILGGRTYYGTDWEMFKALACAYCVRLK